MTRRPSLSCIRYRLFKTAGDSNGCDRNRSDRADGTYQNDHSFHIFPPFTFSVCHILCVLFESMRPGPGRPAVSFCCDDSGPDCCSEPPPLIYLNRYSRLSQDGRPTRTQPATEGCHWHRHGLLNLIPHAAGDRGLSIIAAHFAIQAFYDRIKKVFASIALK